MSKKLKVIVDTGNANLSQALDVTQGQGGNGQPLRIKAVAGAKYELLDLEKAKARGPDNVKVKRVGKNLDILFEGSTEADDDPTAERDQAHKLKIGQRGDDCNGRAELGAEGGDECGVGDGFSGDGLRGAGESEAAAGEGVGGGGLRFREEHAGAGILAEVPRVGGEAADEDHERPALV